LLVKRYSKLLATVAVLGLVAAACGGGGGSSGTTTGGGGGSTPPATSGGAQPTQPQGGTLKIAAPADIAGGWDPAKEYEALAFEFYRCCLTRTMMSFDGTAGTEGNVPHPDLAAEEPTQSSDGLTWTFNIKPGLNYAPPFQDKEIVAADFITALERLSSDEGSAGGYPFYFSIIKGFDDANGKTGAISGLSAPDDQTLKVQLTQPAGDLAFRFTLPATAPVPAEAAKGHIKDYGRFLVASGPYMFDGADQLDFTKPPGDQKPVSGYQPNRAWLLVRNPSYDHSTDTLRQANVDEIQVQIGGEANDLANKVDAGEIDFDIGDVPPPQQIQKYQADPNLQDQIHSNISDAIRYISMNLAEPPFDDIHVRKAVNYVVDKDGLRRARGGPLFGDIATHLILDDLEGNALKDFDPYATPNSRGDVAKAKAEMKQSKYDSNQDGVCDASACDGFLMITDEAPPYPEQNALLEENLGKIGLKPDVRSGDRYTFMYAKCQDPATHSAFCPSPGWGKDYADASTFGEPLFESAAIGSSNYALLGASSALLKKNHYTTTSVPSADDKIKACGAKTGDQRVSCWADLDKYLMTQVVPWVPWLNDKDVDVIGERVLNYTFDQSAGLISVDHLALAS